MSRPRLPKFAGAALTQRQKDVLILLGKGYTDREIGRLLEIALSTVCSHVKSIFARLDVNSRVEAAVWAAKQGWL